LASVATNIVGISGRALLEALIAGGAERTQVDDLERRAVA
jgi:hypothetical protein